MATLRIECWVEGDGPGPETVSGKITRWSGLAGLRWQPPADDPDRGLVKLSAEADLGPVGLADATLATLLAAGRVAFRTVVSGPDQVSPDHWQLAGYVDPGESRLAGVRMIALHLDVTSRPDRAAPR